MNKLKVPYVALIGNHDLLANGEEIFVKVFGIENFSFIAGETKFICLNTNALELDYSRPIPDFQFIRGQLNENDSVKNTVFAMHAPPFSEQFNNNVADVFHDEIKKFPNLLFCLNGHNHRREEKTLFNDGVFYYGVPNIAKRQYYIFTITNEEYSYEMVTF
ncbi:MAG: metallophosphoesterase [Niabella sp.]